MIINEKQKNFQLQIFEASDTECKWQLTTVLNTVQNIHISSFLHLCKPAGIMKFPIAKQFHNVTRSDTIFTHNEITLWENAANVCFIEIAQCEV